MKCTQGCYFTGKTYITVSPLIIGTNESNMYEWACTQNSLGKTKQARTRSLCKPVPQLTVIWKKVSSFLATFDAETA